jgi:addiction module RelE/StbE family toxin
MQLPGYMIQTLRMRMEIRYATRFRKQYRKAAIGVREAFAQTLELFVAEPNHPMLRNHPLKEKFAGFRSIDVTGDWRAVFKEAKAGNRTIITFHLLGTHDTLYGLLR